MAILSDISSHIGVIILDSQEWFGVLKTLSLLKLSPVGIVSGFELVDRLGGLDMGGEVVPGCDYTVGKEVAT